jgi:hypothetical protein
MTETTKVNLTQTANGLAIVSRIVGAVISVVLVLAYFDNRLDAVESKQSTFEGVMQERTLNMGNRIDAIYNIVVDWSPDGKAQAKAKEEARS